LRAGEGRRLASRTERGRISGYFDVAPALDAGDGVISMAAHMRLEEFIKEALLSILRGVTDAQQQGYAGLFVVPQPETGLTRVKFDVAVTVETTRGVKGGDRSKCSQSQKLAARQANQVVNKLQIESSLKFRSFYPVVVPSCRATSGEANGARAVRFSCKFPTV
jgi:hypothetical protein